MLFFLSFFICIFFSIKTFANPLACPVCTIAIAGGLGVSRMLGVDDSVVGVWVGAIMLGFSQWTVYYFEKKNIKNIFIKILCYVGWYTLIIPLYLGDNPSLILNSNKILGVDNFIFSVISGTLVLFLSIKLYRFMKERNNNKPHFPFEKVVLPLSFLVLTSIFFYLTTN